MVMLSRLTWHGNHVRAIFLLLLVLCWYWFIFSNCRALRKGWKLHYLSCEQGEMLLSTCQGDVLHRTTVRKDSWVFTTRKGSALPNLPCLPCLLWGMVETPRLLHSIHLTTHPFLKLENYTPLFDFPLLQGYSLLLVITTLLFLPLFL